VFFSTGRYFAIVPISWCRLSTSIDICPPFGIGDSKFANPILFAYLYCFAISDTVV
jgi:hypothetical protein